MSLLLAVALTCGVERQPAKVLQADVLNLAPRVMTVAEVNALPKHCSKNAASRRGIELQLIQVTAKIKLIKHETDQDLHIVLTDGRQTMVAESPSLKCSAKSRYKTVLKNARSTTEQLHPGDVVTFQGPVFYDFFHHQTGMSKSCAELHPILWVK